MKLIRDVEGSWRFPQKWKRSQERHSAAYYRIRARQSDNLLPGMREVLLWMTMSVCEWARACACPGMFFVNLKVWIIRFSKVFTLVPDWFPHTHFSDTFSMNIYTHIDAWSCYFCSTVPCEFSAPLFVCPPLCICKCVCLSEGVSVCVETPELLCIPDSLLWCRGSRLSYDSSWALSEISEVRHKRIQAERAPQRHTERHGLNKRLDTGLKSTARY